MCRKPCGVLLPVEKMKIVVENHIPYIAHLLEPYAQVLYLETSDITASALKDADVLIKVLTF